MKACVKAFQFLGLLHRTCDDIEFDQTKAVINDEFNRPESAHAGGDYRWRAIRRLIKLRIPWRIETNIAWNVAREFVTIKCPYCNKEMEFTGGGGNGEMQHSEFCCRYCGSKASMKFNSNDFLQFAPNKENEEAKDLL